MDFSKSPRSNPPLLEGPLEISTVHKVHGGGVQVEGGGWYKVTLVLVDTILFSVSISRGKHKERTFYAKRSMPLGFLDVCHPAAYFPGF